MTITLNIPDANAADIVTGVCRTTGWTSGSGVTQQVWAKNQLIAWIKDAAKRGLLMNSQDSITGTIDPLTIN